MASRFSYQAGTAAAVTVPAGAVVSCVRAHNTGGGGTLIITPAGGVALPSIPIPAGAQWLSLDFDTGLEELSNGATLVFAGTDAYYVGQRITGGN